MTARVLRCAADNVYDSLFLCLDGLSRGHISDHRRGGRGAAVGDQELTTRTWWAPSSADHAEVGARGNYKGGDSGLQTYGPV